ncbi:MAG: transposase [Proteobacteria bacterium]|nr:transposase [Pseudomonadota bacterium]MCP4922376.1 transposase [Pseudomonadota bacterium]
MRADDPTLTRFAGIVPVARFANGVLELPSFLRQAAPTPGRRRIYPVHLVLYAFVMGALVGVQRLAHLDWLRGDAVLLRFLRLPAWPVRKVFSRALAGVSDVSLERLQDLLTMLGLRAVSGRKSVVADFDSSAIVAFGEQEGALFGYSGRGRNRRRHHPLVASVAEGRTVFHQKYRDGSAFDAKQVIDFFAESLRRLRQHLPDAKVAYRADSGFWSAKVGDWLLEQDLSFFFALRMHPGVKLMLPTVRFHPADDGEDDLQVGVLDGEALSMDQRIRVTVIRRRIHDRNAPPPGKVIKASPEWRYQAILTNKKDWDPLDVWRFYNDRGDCERVFKTATHGLGMSWLIAHGLRANTVAFLLRLIAFNVDQLFQADAERRATEDGRRVRRHGLLYRQVRLFNCAGRLLKERGRWVLRIARNERLSSLWRFYAPELTSSA